LLQTSSSPTTSLPLVISIFSLSLSLSLSHTHTHTHTHNKLGIETNAFMFSTHNCIASENVDQ
jgi:hypothetical protein